MFIPNVSLKQILSRITKMTSLMKWQHFSCLGLHLQLLSFPNIRKLAISAQVTLHISNAIVNTFRLCPPCIPAGRTQVSRAFIAARCYNSFTLPNSEGHTRPICVGLLFALLTKKKINCGGNDKN